MKEARFVLNRGGEGGMCCNGVRGRYVNKNIKWRINIRINRDEK